MSAMKNVAIAVEECKMVLETMPTAQAEYTIRELVKWAAERNAEEIGVDIPSSADGAEVYSWIGG